MAEDRYQLGAVRDARTREERDRKHELAGAVGDAREARARLDASRSRTQAARQALQGAVTERDLLIAAGSSPARLANADRFVTRRRHELDAALGEELRAEAAHDAHVGAVELERRKLARARADREVIDRHFARWRDAKTKLAERRDD